MNENSQKLATLSTLFLLLASLFLGIKESRTLFGNYRPGGAVAAKEVETQCQTVPARLWQDPFEALNSLTNTATADISILGAASCENAFIFLSKSLKTNTSLPHLKNSIEQKKTNNLLDNLMVLGVTLESAPYVEVAESRRRIRYATEMALLHQQFVPEDRTHIGVDTVKTTNGSHQVAFEWFLSGTNKALLVLWLKEEEFAREPLGGIAAVWNKLSLPTNTTFCLIGPGSSDTLRQMATGPSVTLTNSRPGNFLIFSPEASASDSLLIGDTNDTPNRVVIRERIRTNILYLPANTNTNTNTPNQVLYNCITLDYLLCNKLVEELKSRRITNDVIALVSEADTFYGRSLAGAFMKAAQQPGITNNILCFNYLRGLDGSKPPPPTKERSAVPAASTPESMVQASLKRLKDAGSGDAFGEAQQDYAQRLADYLKRQNADLRVQNKRLAAVGVLGSDFYDKVVLLQMLRESLPEAVFFTTDLDAQLWMNDKFRHCTRNLIVASAQGLDPSGFENQPPPFRNIYQVTVYNACRAAIARWAGSKQDVPEVGEGKLYEIGRGGPVELSTVKDSPSKAHRLNIWGWLGICALYLGFTILGIALLRNERMPDIAGRLQMPNQLPTWRAGVGWIILEVLLISAAVAWAFYTAHSPWEEPWNFTGGVSIWATEIIRLIIVFLTIRFLVDAHLRHKCHRDYLWKNYFAPTKRAALEIEPMSGPIYSVWFYSRRRIEGSTTHMRVPPTASSRGIHHGTEPAETVVCGGHVPREFAEIRCLQQGARVRIAFLRRRRSLWERWRRNLRRIRIASWRPTLIPNRYCPQEKAIYATRLFQGYAYRGLTRFRYLRVVFTALIYVAALAFFAWGADQIPHRLCIRGTASRGADLFLLGTSVACFIVVLFYALDSAQLTGRMLRCLSAASTRWPLWVVQKFASQKCVRPQDLDGWLDVQVAAEKGMETRRLMFLPFILLFLLLVARLPVFEHWTWPAGLSLIFAVNFVLAGTCWAFVRYSARKVKQDAVARLKNIEIEIRGGSATVPTTGPCNVSLSFSKEEYASRLRDLCKEIEDENRGPFVRWIQDPAVIALLIPTGLTGIIAVVLHYWLTDY